MRVTRAMLHPQLRISGTLMRGIWPYYSKLRFKLCNIALRVFVRGRAYTLSAKFRQIRVPREDGSLLRLCVYTPRKPYENAPGLLWMHGGGYAIGLPEQDVLFIKRFVRAGCVVVAPDYTRSVDAPHPAAMLDCYQALLWMRDHAREYHINSSQLFVGGDSAGGGLAASVCLYARDRKDVAVAFQMPLYPMLDDRMITASAKDNNGPVWNARSNRLAWDMYLRGDAGELAVYGAPGRVEDLSGMPPALTFVGSVELFRDEALAYAKRLQAAGVRADIRVFEGCFHGSDMLCFWTGISKQQHKFMMDGLAYAIANYTKEQPQGKPRLP